MDHTDAKRLTMRVSGVGAACNALLTIFKIVAGILARSSAMLADAVHSASDLLGSAAVMLGAAVSHKAADRGHPYGHEKLECLASIAVGMLLTAAGAAIGYAGLRRILSGDALRTPGALALWAAAVSVVVKEALYWYTIRAARRLDSVSLRAEAWHHRSDALSSVGSFAGILAARLGLPIFDPIASLVICVLIFKVAFDVLRESVERLTDHACPEETVAGMRAALPLREAHAIAESAHHAIERDFPAAKHCTVHVNPWEA